MRPQKKVSNSIKEKKKLGHKNKVYGYYDISVAMQGNVISSLLCVSGDWLEYNST